MRVQGDRNFMNPVEIVMPVRTALGDSEWTRIMSEVRLYERYEGDLNVWSDYKNQKISTMNLRKYNLIILKNCKHDCGVAI